MEQTSEAVVPMRVENVEPPPLDDEPKQRLAWSRALWFKATIITLLVGGAIWAVVWGAQFRLQIYSNTSGLHWGDANNASKYGRATLFEHHFGLFHLYEQMHIAQANGANANLPDGTPPVMDYPPLRLMIVAGWARWMQRMETSETPIRNTLDYSGSSSEVIVPMLRINTASELISSIFVFLLIRMWSLRADTAQGRPSPWWRGVPSGCIGAMLLWFNRGLLWNGYAFPQWDTWVIPFFLAAVLMACVECWFAAGVMIAIGAFFKGQMLIVAPLFILWPLFQLKWGAAIKWICGLAFMSSAIVLPFMEPTRAAMIPFMLSVAALAFSIPFVLRMKLNYIFFITLAVVAGCLAWPWTSAAGMWARVIPIGLAGLVWAFRYVPPRMVPQLYALVVAILIFMLMPLYNVSDNWYQVGFKYGTEKFPIVATAGTNNLPSILVRYFQIGGSGEGNSSSEVDVWLFGKMQIRTMLLSLYGICLVLCSFAAARHARKGDPRFLLAMVTPWICSFALLAQLNNRYLNWAAGMSALLPAVGVGMTLLGVVISILAWEGVAQLMYNKYDGGSYWAQTLNPLQTNLGWLLVLAAAVYLYVAIVPRIRPRMRAA